VTVGVTHASIDPTTHVVTLTCVATNQFALTVNGAGNGNGNITSSPAGIACGPQAGTACSSNFFPGAQVTMTATPVANSRFAGWTGACVGAGPCTVTMDAAKALTAQFVATVIVHVTVSELKPSCPDGGGGVSYCTGYTGAHTVFDGGSQGDCVLNYFYSGGDITCDYVVDRGRPSINIDARVDGGVNYAIFDHWNGCDATITTRCSISAAADVTVTAIYSQ
jgi:hypothetical protein